MATSTAHRDSAQPKLRVRKIEWPTIGLIAAVYAVLATLIWFHASIPWWVMMPLGGYAAALHSSLQHEVLHGHPTANRRFNEALVFVSPHMWLPYGRYRDTHLAHHNDAHLTDPDLDPESYYVLPQAWDAMPGLKRLLYQFNQTLFGRMLIGPAVSVAQFWSAELASMSAGETRKIKCWLLFVAGCGITIFYVSFICGMPLWKYVALVAYPAVSLALVRSFCEHQAAEDVGERTIIVEASWFWSLLFLNNNLHLAHHTQPKLPWYEIPAYYRATREALHVRNKAYVMKGYGEIFRRYFFHAKEPVAHPNPQWLAS
jgi:fatty acid desaturase